MNKKIKLLAGVVLPCLAGLFFALDSPDTDRGEAMFLVGMGLGSILFAEQLSLFLNTRIPWGDDEESSPMVLVVWGICAALFGMTMFIFTF